MKNPNDISDKYEWYKTYHFMFWYYLKEIKTGDVHHPQFGVWLYLCDEYYKNLKESLNEIVNLKDIHRI